MGGQFTLGTEIIDSGAQAGPEKLRPEPVHDSTGGDGICFRHDPIGEIETGKTFLFRALDAAGEKRRRRGKNDRTGFILPVAPRKDADLERILDGLCDQGPGTPVVQFTQPGRVLMSEVKCGTVVGGAEKK